MTSTHQRSPWRHRLARACVAAAVACLALAGFGPVGAQEQPGPRPDVFRASASSEVVSAFLDRAALLPVNDAFRFIALDGTGTYESSNQTARASIFYPGNGVISGPALACDTFGGQFPDQFAPILQACRQFDYPLTVFADSLHPDGTTTGSAQLGAPSDPLSAHAVRAVAHAAADASTSDAAITDLRVVGLPAIGAVGTSLPVPGAPELDPTILTVDDATSRTDQRIDETGKLVVESRAVLEGVGLVGGLVHIASIRSVSTIVDDGQGGQTHEANLDVSGVTVGGVPAEITDQGLVIGSPTGAAGPLVQQAVGQLNDLVGGLGLHITTLRNEDGVDDSGVAFARSGGVLVEFDLDAQGLPVLPGPQGDIDPNGIYTAVIQLGDTGVTGLAATIEDAPFTPGTSTTPDVGSLTGPVSSGIDQATPAPVPGLDVVDGSSPTASSGPSAGGQEVVAVSELLAPGRVRLLYLAFTLIALAVCLGPRFALPARFPGRTP